MARGVGAQEFTSLVCFMLLHCGLQWSDVSLPGCPASSPRDVYTAQKSASFPRLTSSQRGHVILPGRAQQNLAPDARSVARDAGCNSGISQAPPFPACPTTFHPSIRSHGSSPRAGPCAEDFTSSLSHFQMTLGNLVHFWVK